MKRYDQWHHLHIRGDHRQAHALLPAARKLLGYLDEQRGLSGVRTAVVQQKLANGSILRASFHGDIPKIEIDVTGAAPEATEDVVALFVSATDGLRIYELDGKRLAKRITGVEDYTLAEVSRDGRTAWMVYTPGTAVAIMARVNIGKVEAFGHSYAVQTVATPDTDPPIAGLAAESDDAALSPDGKHLLMHFAGSMTTGGTLMEGVGGVLVLDPVTLDARRTPLRMTFAPAPMAWAPDSSRFYLGVSCPDDVGDLPATARLAALTESTADYLAVFDAAGTLLATRQLASWLFTPDSGFARSIKAIAASATRVYVTVDAPNAVDYVPGVPTLFVLDATQAGLPVLGSIALDAIAPYAPPNLCLSRDGRLLFLAYADRVAAVDVADEAALAVVADTVDAQFVTWAPTRLAAHDMLQLAPLPRFGGAPDPRRFFYNFDTGVSVVRGYRTFALDAAGLPQPAYTFDLATPGVAFKSSFRLASVRARPRRSPA